MNKQRGHYLGAEIDSKWWKRYRDDGFFIRGMGKWWIDNDVLYFHRFLMKEPLKIPLSQVIKVERGSWHAGKFVGGNRVIKLLWEKDRHTIGAGFVLGSRNDTEHLAEKLSSYR